MIIGKIRFNYFNYFLMGIFIAACAAFFCCTDNASAVSACPGDKVTTQPDGTKITYQMKGDEYFHYYTDTSGNVIQKDGDTGVWKQVVKNGGKVTLGNKVKSVKSATPSNALASSITVSGNITILCLKANSHSHRAKNHQCPV
ncbi:MAG: hypothetical protein VB031_06525 [Eubacteriaceae bacterium]|nr:hypothetical protein [Eubacteriaceae bacterium]